MMHLLEVAASDFESTAAAVRGGAHRIELCANLGEGGTTPSAGSILQCKEAFPLPIFPIIRPRGGDFLYSEEEFAVMRRDLLFCKGWGCEGVVLGALRADGNIDYENIAPLVEIAYPMEVTFHRAFDRVAKPEEAIRQIIRMGCTRLLTSGGATTAPNGAANIRALIDTFGNEIVIMPGSGVRAHNIAELQAETGAVEFHASLRSTISSGMEYANPAFPLDDDATYAGVAEVDVAAMLAALKNA